jgi:Tfp pilus assembly protein PilF
MLRPAVLCATRMLSRAGNESSLTRLTAARSCNESSSAWLAHLASSKKRLGSARSWLTSQLAELTSLGINVNLLFKL